MKASNAMRWLLVAASMRQRVRTCKTGNLVAEIAGYDVACQEWEWASEGRCANVAPPLQSIPRN